MAFELNSGGDGGLSVRRFDGKADGKADGKHSDANLLSSPH
jgi:hypothetical protein